MKNSQYRRVGGAYENIFEIADNEQLKRFRYQLFRKILSVPDKKPPRFPEAVSFFIQLYFKVLFNNADGYRSPSKSAGFAAARDPDVEFLAFYAAAGVRNQVLPGVGTRRYQHLRSEP